MLRVLRVCHRFEKLGISPGATHVLGRAGIGTVDAERHVLARNGRQPFLDFYTMVPTVAKVIHITERLLTVQGFDQGLAGLWLDR
ncbi:hypothetical protein D3C80_1831390 [compost metagenome]